MPKKDKPGSAVTLAGKHIVLGVAGGIAAYKSAELVRALVKKGAVVRVMMTANACRFVGPMTFEALSGNPVCRDLWAGGEETAIPHIEWAGQADAVVIAPATANMIGKLANGIADDALSTFMMAVTSPVLVCPSMNTNMYQNRAVQRNLAILRKDGYEVLEPGTGELACGTSGAGRMPEPDIIVDRLCRLLTPKDMAGKKVLVTAGPTRESIDPVRFISNHSSGRMGYALARAAEYRGAEVTLISGPVNLEPPVNVAVVPVQTAAEMAGETLARVAASHIIVKVAAVGDYRAREVAAQKIKKGGRPELVLHLEENPDILKEIGRKKKKQILVGFAAETQALVKNARTKLAEKNADLIVANIVSGKDSAFGSDTNEVCLLFKDGREERLPRQDKERLAHVLLDRILELS
ncbi:MAG: bifunctional phosphopantothenoylcysteine decarboxylase/phosphopantothenate--cysteine ligase CoaBC [Thermodesulfobacteriota bacterium]